MSSIQRHTIYNRIAAIMAHTTRYAFKGGSRLAADAGVSKSAVCRLLKGQSSPSYALLSRLVQALERHLGRFLDLRDLISLDGTYPTRSVCQLTGCRGCLPAQAYDDEGNLKPQFKGIKPGQWSISQCSTARKKARKPSRRRSAASRTTTSKTATSGRTTSKTQTQEER